jgi:ribonuclease VapC
VIVDSSALLAIILKEPEAKAFAVAVLKAPQPRMSAASYLEVALRLDRLSRGLDPKLEEALKALAIEVVPVEVTHGRFARDASLAFGPGRAAKLNFGDCMTYALAKASGAPLLFKGNDFDKTDLVVVSVAN